MVRGRPRAFCASCRRRGYQTLATRVGRTGDGCAVVCAVGSARAARYLLRHLSQPANEDRGSHLRHDGPGEASRACRRVGEDRPQAARRHDAAARCSPSGPGQRGFDGVVARAFAGRGGGRSSRIPVVSRCIGSIAPNTPPRSKICWDSRSTPAALLPKDDEAEGFDNVASVLTVSPSFLDQYISAARVVSARAIGKSRRTAGQQDLSSGAWDRSVRARRRSAARHARRIAGRAPVPRRRRLQTQYPEHGDRRLRARHGVSPHARRHRSTA